MPGATLTTKEVAKVLHVSEATVKRWADDGLLQSEKTAGGHRRFSTAAIARFGRGRGAEESPVGVKRKIQQPDSPAGDLADSLFVHLIEGDEEEAAALLIHAYLQGHGLAILFDRVVAKAMHRVGELWYRGELTIADEHLAARTAIAALQELRGVIRLALPTGMKAMICGVEGDLHELPVHLVQVLLESDGWKVINLGPNTPFFPFAEAVPKHRPQLVCISAKLLGDPDRIAREFDQVRKVAAKINCRIVIGGDGFADAKLRQRFPADSFAKDLPELVKYAHSLIPAEK